MKEQSKKITIATTLIMLAALLFVAMFGVITKGFADNSLFANNANNNQIEQPNVVDGEGNDMSDGKIYDMPANMSFSAEALAENGTVSVNISATVTPADAENKLVDWSIAWFDGSTDLLVTDYVTVTAQSDGSNVATITCKKAFAKDISVTVTTRDGGFNASCVVSFVGVPTVMTISSSSLTAVTDSTHGTYYSLLTRGGNSPYIFDIGLSNNFNQVGSEFNQYNCKVIGVGNIFVCDKKVPLTNSSTHPFEWSGADTKLSLAEIMNDHTSGKYLNASIVNGKLSITASEILENYRSGNGHQDTFADGSPCALYYGCCKAFAGGPLYFDVEVTETKSGLKQNIHIRTLSGVMGVSLSNSSLQF